MSSSSSSSSSSMVGGVITPPQYQVFINFRGLLRHTFVSHLVTAMRKKMLNFSFDQDENVIGKNLDILFEKIEQSKIGLVIFSEGYTESDWCLNELVKIKECRDQGKLVVIPIFYRVEPATVKHLTGSFGDDLRRKEKEVDELQMEKWKEALQSISKVGGRTFDGMSNESKFISKILKLVLNVLDRISPKESKKGSMDPLRKTGQDPIGKSKPEIFGLKQRLEELEEKVDFKREETRIVGVVGMPGTGKTTLVKELYEKSKSKFIRHGFLQLQDIPGELNKNLKSWRGKLLEMLLQLEILDADEETYETHKENLLKKKVFIVLDGVKHSKEIEVLLERYCDWTRKGSKIVIATGDKSLINKEAHIYVVPPLNHRDGLKHFQHYAEENTEAFMKLSNKFVLFARGHPLVLQQLGEELRGKTAVHWEENLNKLAHKLTPSIEDALRVSYDALDPPLRDAFLDIACFRSLDLVYVKSLLDPEFTEATIEALKDKFLISICDSRLEMHDLLYTLARELISKVYTTDGKGNIKTWENSNQTDEDKINVFRMKQGIRDKVIRRIYVDLSDINKEVTLDMNHFKLMRNLRYLKFYSSHCPRECERNIKEIYIPDGLELPLEEVRYLHWLKFPLHELPTDFKPKNLVELKLPYSKIKRIWENDREAPKLKWVDLNHSSELDNLSGLSQAPDLESLNLEGCTALKTLDPDMKNLESLVFLNLKGCTALEAFPDIELVSLKTLILSDCSSLVSFLVISETLEALFLDGTSITELPTNMVKLTRLIKLNLQDCKQLVKLFQGLGKLDDLQELICSGCSNLRSLPDNMEKMTCLQILLLDGTAITKIPQISSLERLSLSGNNKISLLGDMTQLFQLKWLDLKYCKNLLSIPELPPNLLRLDAHGCASLKTVANPLATHLLMEQIHSTFIFTNCDKLKRAAKEEITTYAQRKCQLLSDAIICCNEGFVPEALFSTCFPGCEIPSWFCYEAVGSELELKLPPHWNENTFVGMALCAVISYPNCQEPINSFSVTCKFNLKCKDGSEISFDRLVGCWNKHGNKPDKMKSDHVFICYTRCSNDIRCLKDQHSGTCTPTEAVLKFNATTDKQTRLEVLKCGLRLVYAFNKPPKTNSDGLLKGKTMP